MNHNSTNKESTSKKKEKRKEIAFFIRENPMLNQLLNQKFDRDSYVIEGPREGAIAQSIRLNS